MQRRKLRLVHDGVADDSIPFPGMGRFRPWRPRIQEDDALDSIENAQRAMEDATQKYDNLRLLTGDNDSGPTKPKAA